MRPLFFCVLGFLFCTINLNGQSQNPTLSESTIPTFTDSEIKARLATINNRIVKPQFDRTVRSYINTYTVKHRDRTEAMLGRTTMYFPLFEKMLVEYGLPQELKYLSVVESALNPLATSRSGAVGLWQFMKPTAKENGLKMNRYVDERRDPVKSTLAAMQYLHKQFKRFGNWELALAAYNGGPGRVNRAIKRGRSKNFWRIRRHLPRETRAYVPAYIAATYIMEYYQEHNLMPQYPDLDLQLTDLVTVYEAISFSEISAITGVSEYIIQVLNPSYKRNFIPANRKGNNLVLPQNGMIAYKTHFRLPDSDDRQQLAGGRISAPATATAAKQPIGRQMHYTAVDGDNLMKLAQMFECTETEIMSWNRLLSRKLRHGQTLKVYVGKDWRKSIEPVSEIDRIAQKATSDDQGVSQNKNWKPIVSLPVAKTKSKRKRFPSFKWNKRDKKYQYHKVSRGESLLDIANDYDISLSELLELNELQRSSFIQVGQRIKVKKK